MITKGLLAVSLLLFPDLAWAQAAPVELTPIPYCWPSAGQKTNPTMPPECRLGWISSSGALCEIEENIRLAMSWMESVSTLALDFASTFTPGLDEEAWNLRERLNDIEDTLPSTVLANMTPPQTTFPKGLYKKVIDSSGKRRQTAVCLLIDCSTDPDGARCEMVSREKGCADLIKAFNEEKELMNNALAIADKITGHGEELARLHALADAAAVRAEALVSLYPATVGLAYFTDPGHTSGRAAGDR